VDHAHERSCPGAVASCALYRGVRVYVYIVYGCSGVYDYSTPTALPLPVLSDVYYYVYALYTYTKICLTIGVSDVCFLYSRNTSTLSGFELL
jgi:hypothetical protein